MKFSAIYFACISILVLSTALAVDQIGASDLTLSDATCRLVWKKNSDGWRLHDVGVSNEFKNLALGAPSGEYTLL